MSIYDVRYDDLRADLRKNLNAGIVKNTWWEMLIEFIELALPFILALLRDEMANPKALIDYLTEQWMTYCNVSWLPDWLEEKVLRQIITVVIEVIIRLFKNGSIS